MSRQAYCKSQGGKQGRCGFHEYLRAEMGCVPGVGSRGLQCNSCGHEGSAGGVRTLYRVLLQVVMGTVSATCFMSSASTMHSAYQPARVAAGKGQGLTEGKRSSAGPVTARWKSMPTLRSAAFMALFAAPSCLSKLLSSTCTRTSSAENLQPMWRAVAKREERTCDPEIADGAEVDVVVGVHRRAGQDACRQSWHNIQWWVRQLCDMCPPFETCWGCMLTSAFASAAASAEPYSP